MASSVAMRSMAERIIEARAPKKQRPEAPACVGRRSPRSTVPGLIFLAGLFLTATLASAATPSSISGYVRDSSGQAQMGAVVEIFSSSAASPLTAFTDAKGFYSIATVVPGSYLVKASAASFLPTLRERIEVASGAHLVVNLTLSTLFEAVRLLPDPKKRSSQDEDDWRWTLRSASRRPILRVFDGEPLVVVADSNGGQQLKARVAFVTGSDTYSGKNVSTSFKVEQSLFTTGRLSFNGQVGAGPGEPSGSFRVAYRRELESGQHPEVALSVRRLASPDAALHHAALNALALSLTDGFTIGDFLDLNYGTELQSVQFRGRVTAARPFGSITGHIGSNALVEYRYSTTEPQTRAEKGYDTTPADLSETDPRVALVDDVPKIERARHQEISLSERFGKNKVMAAAYRDSIRDATIFGAGDVSSDSGDLLPDIYSGTFTFGGGNFAASGLRVAYERELPSQVTATLVYARGGTLNAVERRILDPDAQIFFRSVHQALTTRLSGTAPVLKTRWIASYKWTSGRDAITPVDAFNATAGTADPYLSFFVRQPLPSLSFLPGKMEALIDVRNLLAQGYVPMYGADGKTLYLVQVPRSVRGGLAFNF